MTSEQLNETEVNVQYPGVETMPEHARLWIYKTGKALSKAQKELVLSKGMDFTSQWQTHGEQMVAVVDVLHDRFIVVAADEGKAQASGCSIDTSIGFIKELELHLNMTLTDRMLAIYEVDEEIRSAKLDQLPQLMTLGEINENTMVYDDLVTTKKELDKRFRIRLADSWIMRFTQ